MTSDEQVGQRLHVLHDVGRTCRSPCVASMPESLTITVTPAPVKPKSRIGLHAFDAGELARVVVVVGQRAVGVDRQHVAALQLSARSAPGVASAPCHRQLAKPRPRVMPVAQHLRLVRCLGSARLVRR